ncbi:hypothetical protein FRC07_012368 [Ceratobasidium sp. 392]|nr:hypothetical protein FRC07_012368 [Ceratobasidium sp. 392]
MFDVPLDYNDDTAGKASLAVALYPATNSSNPETLFVNPGGPGKSGVGFIFGRNLRKISEATYGRYNIISWDPRGVGQTHPRADCFATASEECVFWKGSLPDEGPEVLGDFANPSNLDFYDRVDQTDKKLIELGQKCLEHSRDTLKYVGTVATVKDMIALHDALGIEDKAINFWGLSYGTIIGVHFINKYPERVGRVVLDGVLDPIHYGHRPAHEIWPINIMGADQALDGFVSECAFAGPEKCVFAWRGATADDLKERIEEMLRRAYDYKKRLGNETKLRSASIRWLLREGMYDPVLYWPELAKKLRSDWETLVKSKPITYADHHITACDDPQNPNKPPPVYALQAITCADSVDQGDVTTKMVFDKIVEATHTVSRIFGPTWGTVAFLCHQWPTRALERPNSPWTKDLTKKILVIGNDGDPATPFRSAQVVAEALGQSAVLVRQDGWGHTSLAMHSDCTQGILQNYFFNDTVPADGTVCQTVKHTMFSTRPTHLGLTSSVNISSVDFQSWWSTRMEVSLSYANQLLQTLLVALGLEYK